MLFVFNNCVNYKSVGLNNFWAELNPFRLSWVLFETNCNF